MSEGRSSAPCQPADTVGGDSNTAPRSNEPQHSTRWNSTDLLSQALKSLKPSEWRWKKLRTRAQNVLDSADTLAAWEASNPDASASDRVDAIQGHCDICGRFSDAARKYHDTDSELYLPPVDRAETTGLTQDALPGVRMYAEFVLQFQHPPTQAEMEAKAMSNTEYSDVVSDLANWRKPAPDV